jgi:hypothetical protein
VCAQTTESKFISAEDGWFDVSAFLDEKYGFLPMVAPITEPAVGYGAAAGLIFIDQPLGKAQGKFKRPNITAVGGFATENDSWGAALGDMRMLLDDRLQTLAGMLTASINLDFYGIGDDPLLDDDPLHYTLEPRLAFLQGKHQLGESRFLAGLSYVYATTDVTFRAPDWTPGLPVHSTESSVGGLMPSLTYDTRDNIFTPIRGLFVEGTLGLFDEALGSDDEFQRDQLIAMYFVPLSSKVFVGVRGQVAAVSGDAPFYLHPYIALRGAPAMRYQGEAVAHIEGEVRWQFWKRFSLVGFVGTGTAWTEFEEFERSKSIVTGGGGARYEIARKYGIHMGVDLAVGPDETAIYVQLGSAWARP